MYRLMGIEDRNDAIQKSRGPIDWDFGPAAEIDEVLWTCIIKYPQCRSMVLDSFWILGAMYKQNPLPFIETSLTKNLPLLIAMLKNPDPVTLERIVCVLSKVISAGEQFCRAALQSGLLESLYPRIGPHASNEIQQRIVWLLAMVCHKNYTSVTVDYLNIISSILRKCLLLQNVPLISDVMIVIEVLCALHPKRVPLFRTMDIVPLAAAYLDFVCYNVHSIQVYAMRAITPLIFDVNAIQRCSLNIEVIDYLPALLEHPEPIVRTEAERLIRRVFYNDFLCAQILYDRSVIPPVNAMLRVGSLRLQTDIMWLLYSVCLGGDQTTILSFVRGGVVPSIFRLLASELAEAVLIAGNTLFEILCLLDAHSNEMALRIEDCGGHRVLGVLQGSEDEQISLIAHSILNRVFHFEQEVCVEGG